MRPWLLPFLRCPMCEWESSSLTLVSTEQRGDEVLTGCLTCAAGHAYPISDGIPDFLADHETAASAVYDTFWEAHVRQQYAGRTAEYTEKFQAWARLPEPLSQHFAGKVVLDAGCGEGRFTWLAAQLGAARVVGLDYSRDALTRARAAVSGFTSCGLVRGDILHPPLRRVFDYVFSFGVLHHTPDSERGFRALARCLRPGGRISVFVYSPRALPLVIWPLRRVTLGMESARLLRFCDAWGFGYDPARSWVPLARLFRRLGRLDVLGIGRVTFEGLTTPYLREHSLREVLAWFADAGIEPISSTPAVSASGRLLAFREASPKDSRPGTMVSPSTH